jgi:hypothetical protein
VNEKRIKGDLIRLHVRNIESDAPGRYGKFTFDYEISKNDFIIKKENIEQYFMP